MALLNQEPHRRPERVPIVSNVISRILAQSGETLLPEGGARLELLESEKASQKALFRRRSLPIDSKGSWTAAARTDSGIIDVDGG
jgi:hypothetical protein